MKFEDLEVWKRSARMTAELYKELRELQDWGFRDQITRSALSIPSNIAEGIERLTAQIYIGIEIDYIAKEVGDEWLRETREISAMLVGLIKAKQ